MFLSRMPVVRGIAADSLAGQPQRPQTGSIEVPVDGGVLVGSRTGGSGLPALFLHGGPGIDSDQIYGPLVAEMSAAFDVVRYSQRTVPPSSGARPPATVEQHVSDAIKVLDHQKISRAWLIGHSWGGYLALHIARLHPDRVAGIIDIDGLGGANDGGDLTFKRVMKERIAKYGFIPAHFADPAKAPVVTDIRFGDGRTTSQSIFYHLASRKLERALPKIMAPTLFVHGKLDPLPLDESARATAALMPDAAVAVVEGSGHMPWLEQPGSVIDAWKAYAASRPAPPAAAA